MVHWSEFAAEAPELARLGAARFDATGLCLVGTLRRDPRCVVHSTTSDQDGTEGAMRIRSWRPGEPVADRVRG
jgi:hypothetical protein